MHLVDGLVSTPVLVGCSLAAAGGVGLGLRRLDPDRMPQAALCGAVFFVASLIHIPVGPSSVHLLMSGLAGLLLGWVAMPTILVALLLQAVFFGFGGITALGVNVAIMGFPAVAAGVAGRLILRRGGPRAPMLAGAVAGGGAILLAALAVGGVLAMSGEGFLPMVHTLVILHLPVAAVEAAVSAVGIGFVLRLRPDALASASPVRIPVWRTADAPAI